MPFLITLFSVDGVIRSSVVFKRSLQRVPLNRPLVIIKPRIIHCEEGPDGGLRYRLMLFFHLPYIYIFAVKGASSFREQEDH